VIETHEQAGDFRHSRDAELLAQAVNHRSLSQLYDGSHSPGTPIVPFAFLISGSTEFGPRVV
jgi:hypothetical protein